MTWGKEPSYALPSIYYGDPYKAVERIEAQSCKGCKFEKREKFEGIQIVTCRKQRPHGNKCKHFTPVVSI